MVIKSRFSIVLFALVCNNAWAMEADRSAIALDQFPLQQLVKEGAAEQKLKKLQTIANFLLFQAESYQSLKKIVPVLEVLHELQPYRVIDQEGKKHLNAFNMSLDDTIAERYTQTQKDGHTINCLNVYVPEAHALALQIGHFLTDWKLKSAANAHQIDRHLQSECANIRAVAGLVKHYAYSYQLAHLMFATPRGITGFNGDIIHGQMDAKFIDHFELDVTVYQHTMQLPYMRELIVSLARLVEFYRASGSEDDFFEIYIESQCLAEMAHAKKVCAEFERFIPKFQKLYESVSNEMARIIVSLTKNDRDLRKELKNTYSIRMFELFNTNAPRRLEKTEDLGWHYTASYELPTTLDCKVAPLAIFAPEATAENKKSFLPISKSEPVARKPQPKKKNNSQPSSRARSPQHFEESPKASPEEPSKLLKPVAVQAVAPAPCAPRRLQPAAVKIVYDPRVLRWFDPQTKDPVVLHASRESIEYHCFTRLVDQYLVRCGVQTPWQNKAKAHRAKDGCSDMNFSLGGSIQSPHNPKRLVVFSLCKDQKGVCYHRGFDEKENNRLFDEYFAQNCWTVFHRDEFPALKSEQSAPFAQLESKADEVISEDDLCVKIRDNHMNMNIVLYKPAVN